MLLFKKSSDLREWVAGQKNGRQTIGFAPTMGALHAGHLALVEMAHKAGDQAVVSIFVNPKQFNDQSDLDKYPRTPGRDLELLARAGCEAVFLPAVEEVYPPEGNFDLDLDFGSLDKTMEGQFRPGHFAGMATVVKRLLDLVSPHHLYMGQKDYQQFAIVADMIRQLQLPVALRMCPTLREADGLAMSSRNLRLTPEMRRVAPVIYQILVEAGEQLGGEPTESIRREALRKLGDAGLRPEYFDIVDGRTLLPVKNPGEHPAIVACTAAWAGEVRLIDNMMLKTLIPGP